MPQPPDHPDPFRRLVEIMACLRGPDGCPWDREQTHQTLKTYLIEEAHEVCEAIDLADDGELRLELGDLALQIVFHAQLAKEEGLFTVDDVYEAICEKLIRRHPHVFGDVEVSTSSEVLKNWETIKKNEKKGKTDSIRESILDGVPRTLPALQRAQRVQEKAANVGFDWACAADSFRKIEEEFNEVRSALNANDQEEVKTELGDFLFAIVNFARLSGFRAEELLHSATEKFRRRFAAMEKRVVDDGDALDKLTLQQMDEHWEAVKNSE